LALHGGELLTARPVLVIPEEEHRYPLNRGFDGPRSRLLGEDRNLLPPLRFDPKTLELVAYLLNRVSCLTAWTAFDSWCW